MIFPSRSQLIRDLSLTRTDQMEISKRRGSPRRLGFAYQLGFVRVFQRFPVQQPLEICEELLSFVALQAGIDGGLLGDYASWQQTVSRHQIRIREYLGLRSFDPGQERGSPRSGGPTLRFHTKLFMVDSSPCAKTPSIPR